VLHFPRALCTIFFFVTEFALFVNFLFWKTFHMVKSTTILVQLTYFLFRVWNLRYFLRLWNSSEYHYSRVLKKTWRKLILFLEVFFPLTLFFT
jgi:hypothetical protein